LTDRNQKFVFDGSPLWTIEHGLNVMAAAEMTVDELRAAGKLLDDSLSRAPRQWIGDRLTALASMFSVGRTAPDVGSITIWLVEAAAMLSDIPHDILAHSVDEAVKTRTHGHMPSVGEIRQIAEPLLTRRLEQITRLDHLIAAHDGGSHER
jgi:hypothetical protein